MAAFYHQETFEYIPLFHRSTLDKFKLPPTKTSEVQGKGRKRGPAAARKGAKTILDTKITGAPRKMRIQQFEQIQRRDERAEAKARSEAAKANTASRKRSASAASAPVKKARTKKSINVAEASDSDSSSSSSSEVAAKKVPADRRKNIQDIAGAVVGQLVDNMPGEMRVAAVQSMIKAKSVDDFTPDQFFCFANTYYPRPGKRDQKLAMKKLMPALKHERSNAFIDLIDYVVSPEKYGQATKLSTDDLKDCIAMRVKHVKTLTSEKFEALPVCHKTDEECSLCSLTQGQKLHIWIENNILILITTKYNTERSPGQTACLLQQQRDVPCYLPKTASCPLHRRFAGAGRAIAEMMSNAIFFFFPARFILSLPASVEMSAILKKNNTSQNTSTLSFLSKNSPHIKSSPRINTQDIFNSRCSFIGLLSFPLSPSPPFFLFFFFCFRKWSAGLHESWIR